MDGQTDEIGALTFGGSALDRASEVRGDPAALDALRARPDARAVVLWRGKPLVVPEDGDAAPADGGPLALVRLPPDHPLIRETPGPRIFLGREDGAGLWAVDLSSWVPETVDEAALGLFLDPSAQIHPDAPPGAQFLELRAVMTRIGPRDAELAVTAKAVLHWHTSHRFCAACGAESAIAMAGCQRDCPACGAHHFPRTDPVVIMLILDAEGRVLLGRSPAWPEGMYSLLAGFVEPGETLEAAVRREVWEEAGVRVGPVRFLASQPWPWPASLMFGCAGVAEGTEITIDETEIEHALWVPKDRMRGIFAGTDTVIRAPRRGAIAHWILANWVADRLG